MGLLNETQSVSETSSQTQVLEPKYSLGALPPTQSWDFDTQSTLTVLGNSVFELPSAFSVAKITIGSLGATVKITVRIFAEGTT